MTGTAPTQIYTLSLHDALPISPASARRHASAGGPASAIAAGSAVAAAAAPARAATAAVTTARAAAQRRARSEEHTSELQSQSNLVCRLLLEKKKQAIGPNTYRG